MMPKYLILCLFFSVMLFTKANGQTGIYKTYDDFLNGKILKADKGGIHVEPARNKVTIKAGGEKQVFDCNQIFGFIEDGDLYRFPPNSALGNGACKLVVASDYCMWSFEYKEGTYGQGSRDRAIYFISKGVEGTLYSLAGVHPMEKLVAEHKEFKTLYDCTKVKKTSMMHPEFANVNECLVNSPSFQKIAKAIIPPVKN
jgi:hypothetical protein